MDSLTLSTPERVSLSLPVAGVGSRTGAYLIDTAAMFLFWLVVYFVLSLGMQVIDELRALSGITQMVLLIGVFATQWIYWTATETFWNGQSLGKRLVGIRVVREDGSPVGFFESAVRNLLRVIDFLPAAYCLGVITTLFSRQHRRLGDIAAGTLLIREEKIDLDRYVATSPVAAQAVAGPALSAADTELILSFLERAKSLEAEARQRLARGLVTRFGASLPEDERERIAASYEAAEQFLRDRVHASA